MLQTLCFQEQGEGEGVPNGADRAALLNMRVSQVDLFSRTIRLEPGTTKNTNGREVTMTEAVFALLAECVAGKTADDFVLTRRNGKPVRDFRDTWANACRYAGVPGLLFHDLRRTAARNLRPAGIAEGVIMKIGGWRTRSVFERYAIVDQNDIAAAMKKLQASEQKLDNSYSSDTVGPKSDAVSKSVIVV